MQSKIVPVAVFPSTADFLQVDSFYGFPPSYRWALAKTVVTAPAVPATGVEGEEGYVPAVAEQTSLETLIQGNGQFSDAQWNAWTTQSDDTYPLQVAAANLGVTLVS